MKKLLTLTVLAAALALPSIAAAQVQPIPVNQAKGKPISVYAVGTAGGTTLTSAVYDFSAFGAAFIYSSKNAACTSSAVTVIGSSVSASANFVTLTSHNAYKLVPAGGTITYTVAQIPNFVKFRVTSIDDGSQTCAISLFVTPYPFSDTTEVSGASTDGESKPAANTHPVIVGGGEVAGSSYNLRTLQVDATGHPMVVGSAASGAAKAGNPVMVGGQDGTNAVTLLTDSSGHLLAATGSSANQVQGTAAAGAAKAGNPVRVGASDGTNAQDILSDTSGRLMVVGAAAAGAAVAGNPVLMGATDGTNAQRLKVDATNFGLYTAPLAQAFWPNAAPTNASVSTASAAATGLAANACLRVVCNIDVHFRTGTGTPTAVTTDPLLPSKTIESRCLTSSHTALAFITDSGTGTCNVSVAPLTP